MFGLLLIQLLTRIFLHAIYNILWTSAAVCESQSTACDIEKDQSKH